MLRHEQEGRLRAVSVSSAVAFRPTLPPLGSPRHGRWEGSSEGCTGVGTLQDKDVPRPVGTEQPWHSCTLISSILQGSRGQGLGPYTLWIETKGGRASTGAGMGCSQTGRPYPQPPVPPSTYHLGSGLANCHFHLLSCRRVTRGATLVVHGVLTRAPLLEAVGDHLDGPHPLLPVWGHVRGAMSPGQPGPCGRKS